MDEEEGARRSHGSMTSNWKLQGLDMFQSCFLGDVRKMGYKIFVPYNTPRRRALGGPL